MSGSTAGQASHSMAAPGPYSTVEQRQQLLEGIYSNYVELQRQADEVHDRKRLIDVDMFQSKNKEIHDLLFGAVDVNETELGDWATWEKVETIVKKFAYGRPHDRADQRDELAALKERAVTLSEVVVTQRRRLEEYERSLAAVQQEESGILNLLRVKDRELRLLANKYSTSVLQLRQRERECEALRKPIASSDATAKHQQRLCSDLCILIDINKRLEKENTELRGKLHVNYGIFDDPADYDDGSSLAPFTSNRKYDGDTMCTPLGSFSGDKPFRASLLANDKVCAAYLLHSIPISATLMDAHKRTMACVRGIEAEVANAMAILDVDAGGQTLSRGPPFCALGVREGDRENPGAIMVAASSTRALPSSGRSSARTSDPSSRPGAGAGAASQQRSPPDAVRSVGGMKCSSEISGTTSGPTRDPLTREWRETENARADTDHTSPREYGGPDEPLHLVAFHNSPHEASRSGGASNTAIMHPLDSPSSGHANWLAYSDGIGSVDAQKPAALRCSSVDVARQQSVAASSDPHLYDDLASRTQSQFHSHSHSHSQTLDSAPAAALQAAVPAFIVGVRCTNERKVPTTGGDHLYSVDPANGKTRLSSSTPLREQASRHVGRVTLDPAVAPAAPAPAAPGSRPASPRPHYYHPRGRANDGRGHDGDGSKRGSDSTGATVGKVAPELRDGQNSRASGVLSATPLSIILSARGVRDDLLALSGDVRAMQEEMSSLLDLLAAMVGSGSIDLAAVSERRAQACASHGARNPQCGPETPDELAQRVAMAVLEQVTEQRVIEALSRDHGIILPSGGNGWSPSAGTAKPAAAGPDPPASGPGSPAWGGSGSGLGSGRNIPAPRAGVSGGGGGGGAPESDAAERGDAALWFAEKLRHMALDVARAAAFSGCPSTSMAGTAQSPAPGRADESVPHSRGMRNPQGDWPRDREAPSSGTHVVAPGWSLEELYSQAVPGKPPMTTADDSAACPYGVPGDTVLNDTGGRDYPHRTAAILELNLPGFTSHGNMNVSGQGGRPLRNPPSARGAANNPWESEKPWFLAGAEEPAAALVHGSPTSKFTGKHHDDVLAMLRAFHLRAGAYGDSWEERIQRIRPIVFGYQSRAVGSMRDAVSTAAAVSGALFSRQFDDTVRDEVAPFAAAAVALANGTRVLDDPLFAAIRQLQSEERARERGSRHLLLKRVATNLRVRALFGNPLFQGNAFLSYFSVLYNRWHTDLEEQRRRMAADMSVEALQANLRRTYFEHLAKPESGPLPSPHPTDDAGIVVLPPLVRGRLAQADDTAAVQQPRAFLRPRGVFTASSVHFQQVTLPHDRT